MLGVFRDKDTLASLETEGVAIRREGPPTFVLASPCMTDQSGSKDLSNGAGRGLSQVRSLGKGLG